MKVVCLGGSAWKHPRISRGHVQDTTCHLGGVYQAALGLTTALKNAGRLPMPRWVGFDLSALGA